MILFLHLFICNCCILGLSFGGLPGTRTEVWFLFAALMLMSKIPKAVKLPPDLALAKPSKSPKMLRLIKQGSAPVSELDFLTEGNCCSVFSHVSVVICKVQNTEK